MSLLNVESTEKVTDTSEAGVVSSLLIFIIYLVFLQLVKQTLAPPFSDSAFPCHASQNKCDDLDKMLRPGYLLANIPTKPSIGRSRYEVNGS
jgi:hypothetical protein